MPPIGKGRPFYSHLYHGHRANLLLNRDCHPETQEGKRERHRVSGCCSCCCAPAQRGSACRCSGCCCCGSERAAAPAGRQGCPKAARETSSYPEKIKLTSNASLQHPSAKALRRTNMFFHFRKNRDISGKKIMQCTMDTTYMDCWGNVHTLQCKVNIHNSTHASVVFLWFL